MTNLHHPSIVRYSTSWVEFEVDFEKMKEFYEKQMENNISKALKVKASVNDNISSKEINSSPNVINQN